MKCGKDMITHVSAANHQLIPNLHKNHRVFTLKLKRFVSFYLFHGILLLFLFFLNIDKRLWVTELQSFSTQNTEPD